MLHVHWKHLFPPARGSKDADLPVLVFQLHKPSTHSALRKLMSPRDSDPLIMRASRQRRRKLDLGSPDRPCLDRRLGSVKVAAHRVLLNRARRRPHERLSVRRTDEHLKHLLAKGDEFPLPPMKCISLLDVARPELRRFMLAHLTLRFSMTRRKLGRTFAEQRRRGPPFQ